MKKLGSNGCDLSINEKIDKKPEYKKMINNLLGIASRDNSIFTSSKYDNLDLNSLISEKDFSKVYSKPTFTVNISGQKMNYFLNEIENIDNVNEFIAYFDSASIFLSISDRNLLEKDFLENKNAIIKKLLKDKNKTIAKWKKFRNKYLDKQAQTNSWPLYVATMIFKVRTEKVTLYAPLIMKKVEIVITKSNNVKIQSIDDSIDINEKLLFLLENEYKFSLPDLDEEKDYSLSEIATKYKIALAKIIEPDFDFKGKFEYFTKGEVKNINLQYAQGIILTLSSPGGGQLRDKLLEIINKDQEDEVLDTDWERNVKEEVDKDFKSGDSIYRINPTDISQEKAILGSIKDSSIIWGPPGTGKSQTIANIIANLLANNNTAIVTSEKKAALDVIKERMGKLSKYMFFGLVGKNVDKKEFYKPFNDLIKSISQDCDVEHKKSEHILSKIEWDVIKQNEELGKEDIKALANVWNEVKDDRKLFKWSIEVHQFILKNTDFVDKIDKTGVKKAISQQSIKRNVFGFYPKSIRKIKSFYQKTGGNYVLLKTLLKISNIKLLLKIDDLVNIEKTFATKRNIFNSDDEGYLEVVLAQRFRKRLKTLQAKEGSSKQIKTFIKNCQSGFRIPYKFVNIYKKVIIDLFDVFISTPQTLANTIDMNFKYDYAIFDEASQLHIEKAFPFLFIANKSIISGDNQQMQPSNFFSVRDNTKLDNEYEGDVSSLLQFAYNKGLQSREYMLTKNYRSKLSDLMLFSSKEFYKGKLDVIDHKDYINYEAIKIFNINGKWEQRINKKEAEKMLDILLDKSSDYEKIILLTLNSTQKQYVEALIYSNEIYFPIMDMIKDGKVVLRNLENIQGDEADLVIVSVAYDKSAHLGSTYVARPEGSNALNVAISRAKEKMIVLKSICANEFPRISNNSIRVFRDWIAYLEKKSKDRKRISLESSKKTETFESGFEEEAYDQLRKEIKVFDKARITTQFVIGSYRIDLAIIDDSKGFLLGIEVDGYRYHSGFEKQVQDFERQRFIEAKGYSPIYRITELRWKIEREKIIEEIQYLLLMSK